MKRILCALIALIMTGGIFMTSCTGGESPVSAAESASEPEISEQSRADISEETSRAIEPDGNDIAFGCPYFYECGATVKGDPYVTSLTDGSEDGFVTLTPSLDKKGEGYTFEAADWNGGTHKLEVDNSTAAISVDLGFMSETEGFSLKLRNYAGGECEVYYSTDGYNFSFCAGRCGVASADGITGEISFTAKAVMFVLPFSASEPLEISEIKIFGTRAHDRELLSLGASYTCEGKQRAQYTDDGKKLTDGKTAQTDGDEAVMSSISSEKDERTGKTGTVINLDLGEVKHVSEVAFGCYFPASQNPEPPKRVEARYSADGETWYDLGQSFLRTSVAERGGASRRFLITRNHTVEARYVKVFTYTPTVFMTDEISVYGCGEPVAEPDYGFINKKNQLSNSNVAAFADASLNGENSALITDLLYESGERTAKGENSVKITLAKKQALCGASITVKGGGVENVKVFLGGAEYGDADVRFVRAGSKQTYYIYFDTAESKTLELKFDTEKPVTLLEAAAYACQPQLPLVRGGFFQLSTAGNGGFYGAENDAYSWYLQLKGMKDLGMDYVVIQYSTHYNAKTTLINGPRITDAGYKYTANYGVEDVCEAVLAAADKLGMKVWLGTIHDSDFNSPVQNTAAYRKIVADSEYIIKDIYEMYAHHASFAGYYLSDEECDQWLNMNGGVAAARLVYGGQSQIIRALDEKLSIMIAPAIWRSGKPETGADSLYKAICAETEGGRPIVDIVAAQDCLGRLNTLTVDDATYDAYDKYCAEWAKAVRRAGAEFWHDAEVFETTGTAKRYDELIKSLSIEAKHSGSVIVFDVPHYFTQFPTAEYDNVKQYYMRLIMRKYASYVSDYAGLDRVGEKSGVPEVQTDDGKVIEEPTAAEAKIYEKQYNPGVIVNGTPAADGSDSVLQPFKLGNGSAKPEFAYYADDDAFYVVVSTHDATDDHANGTWWTGKDDLLQIWMITTGETASVATDNDHGIRFYLHRTARGWEKGGTAGSAISLDAFEYTEKDGVFVIKMPWTALGIKRPAAGSGAAMGIVIQYIDGKDESWATSQGSKGQSVDSNALYSY